MDDGVGDRRREALFQAALALASELSLPALLQKIVTVACTVADARYGALGVLSRDGTRLDDFITHGITQEERDRIGDLPVGHGILGLLIMEGTPLRLRRISDHPLSVGFPPHHPPMTSFLGVPVRSRGQVYGNLYLTEKRGAEEFTEDDQQAVTTLAAHAGIAVENARLHEEVRRLAVLEDRERIAKELHDGVVQALFSVGMSMQAAEDMVDSPDAIRKRLRESVGAIDDVIRDLRNYIFGLGPSGVADRQLGSALEDVVSEFRRGSDVAIRLDVDPRAASEVTSRAGDIVQAVREAISNAVRHGQPATLSVTLERHDGGVLLEIEDDGRGFDPESVKGGGRGLSNLRERVKSAGGELTIRSAEGEGATLWLRFPV